MSCLFGAALRRSAGTEALSRWVPLPHRLIDQPKIRPVSVWQARTPTRTSAPRLRGGQTSFRLSSPILSGPCPLQGAGGLSAGFEVGFWVGWQFGF